MIYLVLRSGEKEIPLLERSFREEAAYRTEEGVTVTALLNWEMLSEFLAKKTQADVGCVDVTDPEGILQAELLRTSYPDLILVLLASPEMSPVTYLKPAVLAAGLLLKPVSEEAAAGVFREILLNLLPEPGKGTFLLETRDERQRLPYGNILYFEARAKKIYACMEDREYGFYDTIDRLEQSLPPLFVRCHRSYLVNSGWIAGVKLSSGCLRLKNDIELPLSRSYKNRFKEKKR